MRKAASPLDLISGYVKQFLEADHAVDLMSDASIPIPLSGRQRRAY